MYTCKKGIVLNKENLKRRSTDDVEGVLETEVVKVLEDQIEDIKEVEEVSDEDEVLVQAPSTYLKEEHHSYLNENKVLSAEEQIEKNKKDSEVSIDSSSLTTVSKQEKKEDSFVDTMLTSIGSIFNKKSEKNPFNCCSNINELNVDFLVDGIKLKKGIFFANSHLSFIDSGIVPQKHNLLVLFKEDEEKEFLLYTGKWWSHLPTSLESFNPLNIEFREYIKNEIKEV